MASIDSLNTRREITAGGKTYHYYSLRAAEDAGLAGVAHLPVSLKVLLENQLRFEDGISVGEDDLKAFASWINNKGSAEHEISFRPARVLMQDFTGVPAVVDLAAMRDALAKLGADAAKINPLVPVDLVIDHSVMVDYFGAGDLVRPQRRQAEYERQPRAGYRFLRWGSSAFNNFRVAPPRHGHLRYQVNLIPGPDRSGPTVSATTSTPTPTRWSAPTATPPWSTASRCWAGALAASRRRRPCSASRS